MKRETYEKGNILLGVLVFAVVATTIVVGLSTWGATILKSIRNVEQREQAFQIAEAGINYYEWHLAQLPDDYRDGTDHAGPYVHEFEDKDGNVIGSFSLMITAPPVGSTLVTIRSTGSLASSTSVSRTIEAILAIPSLAKYATVANDDMRFGTSTEVFGPIHSNKGIRFDGLAHNIVTSAVTSYDDPDHSGAVEFGVHTHKSAPPNPVIDESFRSVEAPPYSVVSRPDIFVAGRQFPVPSVDFAGLTADVASLKTLAQANGKYFSSSGAQGYHVVFKTDGTFDVYKVTALQSAPSGCSNSATQWGTWSIKTPLSSNQTLVGNYPYPGNGVLFFEDHVWVDGQISNGRITVAAGIIGNTDPTKDSNITVNSNLLYSNYDGSDVIGLIAQGNINIGLMSEDTIRVDGALIAEKGRVGRFYYGQSCYITVDSQKIDYYKRSSLTLYGMIATNKRYGFAYTDNTGYTIRNIIYDSNLLYGPPPSFPRATTQYQVISWREIYN